MAERLKLERSIEELEGDYWIAPQDGSTRLVEEAHRLRRIPLRALTVEDLRLLAGQQIALYLVMPLTVQLLADDPLASGDLFVGDLLTAALRVPSKFWSNHLT